MPKLGQIFDQCRKASYFSRTDDEIASAINKGGFALFSATLKEFRGYFLKWDTTTIAIAANQDTYALPADFGQMIQLAERQTASDPWSPMTPLNLNSRYFINSQFDFAGADPGGLNSQYVYDIYEDGAQAEQGVTQYQVKLAPMPQQALQCQIIYAATWLEINSPNSLLMLPPEATHALQDYAIAELLQRNGDQNAGAYWQTGKDLEDRYLTFVRERQIQHQSTVEPYVDDLS